MLDTYFYLSVEKKTTGMPFLKKAILFIRVVTQNAVCITHID
jgi:hypothetical protein